MTESLAAYLPWFRTFVEHTRWQFARTYVESYPHEYTVVRWGEPESFARAVSVIERWGVQESFWGTTRKYLYVDERKYWHMDDLAANPGAVPTLINRTWVDVLNYRSNAQALGYDGDRLERLAKGWVLMLDRARNAR